MTNRTDDRGLSRRQVMMGLAMGATAFVAGCTTSGSRARILEGPVGGRLGGSDPQFQSMYGPIEDEGYLIPAIDPSRVDSMYFRQIVADPTGERPGTVVIDTANYFAYVVQDGGTAMRYGVGLGRDGFAWSGNAVMQWKRKWPRWTPPAEMIARQPELEQYREGQEPGLRNPLGARALYLFQNGEDTLYRLHGTPEYWTIGSSVSSGCVRFMNHDIIDLYERVPNGSTVVVVQNGMV
ncbi:MAG: L,D-transpeptidase [Rhizobiaceae bacterium]|nr:L,D-transpeptidase [Rhizobiaceae bacterium]